MTRAVAARHILQRIRLDPRLAYLIGPGSESFELLIEEAADAQHIDIDAMRVMQTKGLQFQPWPSENAIQIRIEEAVEAARVAAPQQSLHNAYTPALVLLTPDQTSAIKPIIDAMGRDETLMAQVYEDGLRLKVLTADETEKLRIALGTQGGGISRFATVVHRKINEARTT